MDYLYALQQLREGPLAFLETVFLFISEYLLLLSPVIAAIFYWCVDKKVGERALFSIGAGQLATSFVKQTACIYRPWIRDPRLHLAGGAEELAADYSFPSGHVTMAVSLFGTLANKYRRKKWAVALCAVLVALMMFARNFLGAHTIEDVLAGLVLSFAVAILIGRMFEALDRHPEKDILVFAVGMVLSIAFILYIQFKRYPMDYNEAGELLVDFKLMRADAFGSAGIMMGILIGWIADRKWIRFSVEGTVWQRILRGIVGTAVFALMYMVVLKKLTAGMDAGLAKFLRYFGTVIVSMTLYPIAVGLVRKALKKKTAA